MSSSDHGISDQSVPLSHELKRPPPFGSGKPVQVEDIVIANRLHLRDGASDLRGEGRALQILVREMEALRQSHNTLQILVDKRTAQLQQLTSTLMTLQDEERRRIARELHDSAGQDLAAIEMNLTFLIGEDSQRTASEVSFISDALEAVRHCTSEIRTLSYLLHPPLLDEFGLLSAVAHFAEGFSRRSGIDIHLDIPQDLGRFDTKIETAMFRVVQQSVANIHRHSGAFAAEIQMEADAEQICVQVRDQGRGITPEVIARINSSNQIVGIGIAGMRERINGLGGRFHVRSGRDGTVVEVSLPVVQEQ